MLIPFIIERSYDRESIWSKAIISGIESEVMRKKYSQVCIDSGSYRERDYDELFSGGQARVVVLVGTSPSWIPEVIAFLTERDVDILLVSYQPPENVPVRGVVRIDYTAGIDTLLRHLRACGCKRTALYGCFPNSSPDLIKRRAFLECASSDDAVFENRSGLYDCYESFRPHIAEYDSAICVNDIAAASLINRLRTDGVGVPDGLQVACFGSSEISRLYRPAITSLIMPNFELGRQTVTAFAYLSRSARSVNLSVRVAGELDVRESTLPLDPARPLVEPSRDKNRFASSFYDDDEVCAFTTLEKLLTACDTIDRRMIACFLTGHTAERIAEELSFAPETVRYRLRRLLAVTGFSSRSELLSYIRLNSFGEVFDTAGGKEKSVEGRFL